MMVGSQLKIFSIIFLTFVFMNMSAAYAKQSPSWKIKHGALLFSKYCSSCHGDRGQGGVGVPLALPDFINNVDDNYLYRTIRLGRPGRVMPSFRKLPRRDINAIIVYMRSWTGRKPKRFTTLPVKGNPKIGKQLYLKHCATCHGDKGQGGRGTGVTMSRPRGLPILAPALNNPGFLAAANDAMIKHVLVHGRRGTPMQSFLKQGLSENNINDIVAYIRSLAQQPIPASAKLLTAEAPVIIRESKYGLKETVENLKNAVLNANMRLIRVQYLTQGFDRPGQEDKRQVIVYSCNFRFLYDALKVDPRVGLFLPCRITIVEHRGKVLVMSINPKRLSALFNNTELNRLCEQMHTIYTEILEETVL